MDGKRTQLRQRVDQHQALVNRLVAHERQGAEAEARCRRTAPRPVDATTLRKYAATRRVPRGDLQPGGPVFVGSPIHHVGLHAGGGRMIDASTYGRPLAVRSILRSGYVGAGRPGV